MTMPTEDHPGREADDPESAVESFLRAVGKSSSSDIHHRLLRACRQTNPSGALKREFQQILSEIINVA